MEKETKPKKTKDLAKVMAERFEKNIRAVLKEEAADKEKYKQEDYKSCKARAADMLAEAHNEDNKFLAYAILMHREGSHEEKRTLEKEALALNLQSSEIKIIEENATRGWWRL